MSDAVRAVNFEGFFVVWTRQREWAQLVNHPLIKAGAFRVPSWRTRLMHAAAADQNRFLYAEMSSVNPVSFCRVP